MKLIRPGLLAFAALLAAGGVQAHHSVAMFNPAKTEMLQGTVWKFEWTNPHAWIWIIPEGDSQGQQARGFECAALAMLRRQGWSRDDIKPGDRVTITFHPYRNGDPGGMMLSVRFADGHILGDRAAAGPPSN